MNNIEQNKKTLLNSNNEIEKLSFKFIKELIKLYKQKKCSYDYIVLTTRRCFCLFYATKNNLKLIIKNIFWFLINYYYLKEIEKKICSSQSVDIIGENFKDSIVLLVDDIMIHGQTVYSYYKKISSYNAKDIDTFVLIRNVERPDYYSKQTKKKYISIHNKVNWDWRDMSNKIVSYLHNIGQLYVSYIYGYNISNDNLYNVIDSQKLIKCEEDFSCYIKHPVYANDCQPQYYYIPQYSEYKYIECAFLRVYPIKYRFGIRYKILPYIELSSFKSDNIRNIWESIWKHRIPIELQPIKSTEDIYKAITAILSYVVCRKLFGQNATISTPEIDKSFIKNFLKIVEKNLCEDPFRILEEKFESIDEIEDNIYVPETYMEDELKKFDFSESLCNFDVLERIKQYFYSVSKAEEEDVDEIINTNIDKMDSIKEKQTPISTSRFYKFIPKEIKIECLGFMLYLLDNGVASHVVRTFGPSQIVATSLKAGEQSYHLFSDLLGTSLKAVYFLLTNSSKTRKANDVENLKCQFVKKLKELKIRNLASIEYVLNRPPVNLKADYFGVIRLRNSYLTNDEICEENKIIEVLKEII